MTPREQLIHTSEVNTAISVLELAETSVANLDNLKKLAKSFEQELEEAYKAQSSDSDFQEEVLAWNVVAGDGISSKPEEHASQKPGFCKGLKLASILCRTPVSQLSRLKRPGECWVSLCSTQLTDLLSGINSGIAQA